MIQVHASFSPFNLLVSAHKRLQSITSIRSTVYKYSNLGSSVAVPAPRFRFGECVESAFDSESGNHFINRGVIVGIVWSHPDWPSRSGQWAYYVEFYQMPSDPHLDLPWTDLMIEDELELIIS